MEGGGGMGSEDGMGDDMGDGQGGGGPGGRGMDSVDHDVGTPATGPTLVEQVRYSTWCIQIRSKYPNLENGENISWIDLVDKHLYYILGKKEKGVTRQKT